MENHMTKKKIISLAMVFAMVAALAIGGTLAYFTDTDDAINTFTVGSVEIRLNEDERKAKENGALQDFTDDKKLLPLVGSAQSDDKTTVDNSEYGVNAEWQVPNAANWVDKIVSVTNTSTETAYVRVLFAFPAKMDDADSAANMMMHWNHDGNMPAGVWSQADAGVKVDIGPEMVDNESYNDYNVYNYTYLLPLDAGKTTEWPAITGVYIDSRVDATQWGENGPITYYLKDEKAGLNKEAYFVAGDGPKMYVLAQAVQADGFADAFEALEAGFPDLEGNVQDWFNAIQD